jgi:hypothetical protein
MVNLKLLLFVHNAFGVKFLTIENIEMTGCNPSPD